MDKLKDVSIKILVGVPFVGTLLLSSGCTPGVIDTIVKTSQAGETNPLPDDFTKTLGLLPTEVNYELTPTVQNPAPQELTLVPETEVPTATATVIPTPESTVNPDIEMVDEELAEQIKAAMPSMWVYDHEQKKFVERSNEDFKFTIYKKTTLYITDGNGEEVGFARYFVKNSPDAEMTEYYSLTDMSKDTVIPIKLYSQMGDYTAKKMTQKGNFDTKQCMYGFVDEYTEFRLNTIYPQEAVDISKKYAFDGIGNIQNGEKMIETALLKALANITGESEKKLFMNFQNGVTVKLETNKGECVKAR